MITSYSNPFSGFANRLMQFALVLTIAGFVFDTSAIAAQSVKVVVDQARLMRLSTAASTVIIGNPVIADVSIQDGQLLVVMGKSAGLTNMIALDSKGREIANVNIIVQANGINSLTLYKGSSRVSMNCSPNCERTLYVGDSVPEFEKIEKQITKKLKAVRAAADFAK